MVMTKNAIYSVMRKKVMELIRPELVDDLTHGMVYPHGGTNPSYETMHHVKISIPYYGGYIHGYMGPAYDRNYVTI